MTPCCFVSFLPPKSFVNFFENSCGVRPMCFEQRATEERARRWRVPRGAQFSTQQISKRKWKTAEPTPTHQLRLLECHTTSRSDISPNYTWLVTSRLDTTRHVWRVRRVLRVARVLTIVSSASWGACWALCDERVERFVTSVLSA